MFYERSVRHKTIDFQNPLKTSTLVTIPVVHSLARSFFRSLPARHTTNFNKSDFVFITWVALDSIEIYWLLGSDDRCIVKPVETFQLFEKEFSRMIFDQAQSTCSHVRTFHGSSQPDCTTLAAHKSNENLTDD